MNVHKFMTDTSTDGVGVSFTNTGELSVFAVKVRGSLGPAFIDILVDFEGGEDWADVGDLRTSKTAQLLILPAGASCNVKLSGATADTKVSVLAAS